MTYKDMVRGTKDSPYYCQRWRMVQRAFRLEFHLPPKNYILRWPMLKEKENEGDKV